VRDEVCAHTRVSKKRKKRVNHDEKERQKERNTQRKKQRKGHNDKKEMIRDRKERISFIERHEKERSGNRVENEHRRNREGIMLIKK
jgi:hypothetical protein